MSENHRPVIEEALVELRKMQQNMKRGVEENSFQRLVQNLYRYRHPCCMDDDVKRFLSNARQYSSAESLSKCVSAIIEECESISFCTEKPLSNVIEAEWGCPAKEIISAICLDTLPRPSVIHNSSNAIWRVLTVDSAGNEFGYYTSHCNQIYNRDSKTYSYVA